MQFITDIDQINHILNIQGLIGLQQYDIFDGLAVRGRVVFKNRRKPGFDLSESDLLVIDIILPVAGNDQHDVFLTATCSAVLECGSSTFNAIGVTIVEMIRKNSSRKT